MIYVVLGLLNLASLGALAFVVVNSRRERETTAKGIQILIESGERERERAREERQELANRIQRPESTPVYSIPEGQEQSITFDSDEEFWETKSNGDSP